MNKKNEKHNTNKKTGGGATSAAAAHSGTRAGGRRAADTRREIVRWGAIAFLEKGFTEAKARDIARAAGVALGSYTRHFPTKEDLLLELVKQVGEAQAEYIGRYVSGGDGKRIPGEVAFGMEIGVLLTICTEQARIRELYCMAYSLPKTLDYIRKFSWQKSQALLGSLLPEWTERMYYKTEVLTTGMVFGSIMAPIGPLYPLNEKIEYTIDSILTLYGIAAETRAEIIKQVAETDLSAIAGEMVESLIEGLGASRDKADESA